MNLVALQAFFRGRFEPGFPFCQPGQHRLYMPWSSHTWPHDVLQTAAEYHATPKIALVKITSEK